MRRPELATHRAVAEYLQAVLPPSVFWTTFPAGGGGRARGAQLKAIGLQAGVPDILVIYCGRTYFIELKAPRGRLSEAQETCHPRIWEAGAPVGIAKSVDDVRSLLAGWGIPTREAQARAA